MALKPGTILGHYEIVVLIGVGGMGEVYRAHDTVLARDVALKVLPEAFARDPDRIARFKREARLLASLNHTNIAAIYGLEEDHGTHFLVMELVLGDTLRDRITRDGPVPVQETLSIGKQIAEALEHAHEKTIIHRDLKPANVKVTPEGLVKVLDFGLAKAFAAAESESDIENAPTLSASPTVPGAILGTPAYMSPEQAKGKKVDRRTDIWALGCVLFELLTGKQAFAGEDISDTLASVLKSDPDWQGLPADAPAHLRFLLRRCLEKDATRRFRDASDVRIEIEEALAAPPPPAPTPPLPAIPAKPPWQRALPSVLTGLAAALLASAAVWTLKPTPPKPVTRTVIALPQDERLDTSNWHIFALSPDGSHLVYAATRGGNQQLYLRAMDSLEARPIPGTEGADLPFFSPDGQSLGFWAGGKLKKVSLSGGAALNLSDVLNPRRGNLGRERPHYLHASN